MATPHISGSIENINSPTRVSRLSFRFLQLAKINQNNMIKMSQTIDITLQPMQ